MITLKPGRLKKTQDGRKNICKVIRLTRLTGKRSKETCKGEELYRAAGIRAGLCPESFVFQCFIWAAVCFAASFGRMAGSPSYINVACAVIAGRFSPAALLGAVAAYSITGTLFSSSVQIAAMLITVAVNVFFPYFSKNGDPVRLSLYTASVTLLLSCVISAVGADSFSVSMRILNSLMCACSVYAAAFILQRFRSGEPIRLQGLSLVYSIMLYIVVIATLSSCQLFIFNIGRVISCVIIPEAAKKYRAAGGAVMGALTAVSVTLCSSVLGANTMLLAAAGLICSAFSEFGRLAAALSFMISACAALATTGFNSDTLNMLSDIIAGSAIFAAMPSHMISAAASRIMISASPADNAGQTASSRLSFASMTLSDIKDKLTLASQTAQTRAETLTLGERVQRDLCPGCRLYDDCRKNGTVKNLENACNTAPSEKIRVSGCIRSADLQKVLMKCRDEQLADRAEAVRLKEMRIFMREQLGSMTDILNDLAFRLSRKRQIDTRLSSSAKSYFERQGFSGVRACVYKDENCCRHAEIFITGEFSAEAIPITTGLCRALECDFELPGITAANRITKLEFDEIPPFYAEFGSYEATGPDSSCSGDTLENVCCSAGEQYILLSDGMGSGKRARLDSAMSVNLASRMLRSGLSMTTAQRLINSVMRVKEWEESFATLDFLRLDLFSGRAEFLKSGAAPAYLCRDGGMIRIDCDSYPAGILSSCDPDVSSCKLFPGDVLVLASDGAPEDALRRCSQIIADTPQADAEKLAFMIGSMCKAAEESDKISENHSDDLTIAVVRISYKGELGAL